MPRSKRDKKISLTKTQKKGLAFKQKLVEDIRSNIERYERIFVFSVFNLRTSHLKDARSQLSQSRFFFGKTKVMALALGKTEETEVKKNLRLLAEQVRGQCGLILTNLPQEEVIKFFETYVQKEFARSGFKATSTVVLPKGPILDFKSSMEPLMRKLGLPTEVKLGKTELREDYTVCKKGDILNPNQAQILKLINEYMEEFRLTLKCVWNKEDGNFEFLSKSESDGMVDEIVDDSDAEMEADDDE